MKLNEELKKRIDKGYEIVKSMREQGKDTTGFEKQILLLEKKYIEQAFSIFLTESETDELKTIVDVKSIFPGSKVIGISTSDRTQKKWQTRNLKIVQIQHLDGEGGETDMFIEYEPIIEPDVYDSEIFRAEQTNGKYGARLAITFEIPDGRRINGYYPPKVTATNKLGKLVKRVLGTIESFDTDRLIGKKVRIVVTHREANGNVYANVSDIL